MAGVSFNNYDQAYRPVHQGNKGIMPAAAGLAAGVAPLAAVKPETKIEEPDEMQRVRETSAVMWRLNKYQTITGACGTKLRVPPKFKEQKIKCLHCGRIHPV